MANFVTMQPEQIAAHTALSAFFSLFQWRAIFGKIKVLHHSVCSSAILNILHLKHFPLADILSDILNEVRRLNRQSHIRCTQLN